MLQPAPPRYAAPLPGQLRPGSNSRSADGNLAGGVLHKGLPREKIRPRCLLMSSPATPALVPLAQVAPHPAWSSTVPRRCIPNLGYGRATVGRRPPSWCLRGTTLRTCWTRWTCWREVQVVARGAVRLLRSCRDWAPLAGRGGWRCVRRPRRGHGAAACRKAGAPSRPGYRWADR